MSNFIENRKRFMVKLPKIKYGNVHDEIYRAMLKPETLGDLEKFLFRTYIRSV